MVEGKPFVGYLHAISVSGGLASTTGPVKEGTFADIAMQTAQGKVTGAIEFLRAQESRHAFRFVYLDPKDQERLNSIVALMRKQGLSA